MKKHFETFLLSVLLCMSIVLGLAFWLNIKFNFNLFSAQHWDELAKLQVSHTPIDPVFYISIGVALFILISGLYMIYRPKLRKISIYNNAPVTTKIAQPTVQEKNIEPQKTTSISPTLLQRPPKLNLSQKTLSATQPNTQTTATPKQGSNRVTIYDTQLSQIFSDNNYLVKPNITVAGFTSNVFAIGKDEILWIGGVDCDIKIFKQVVEKLQSIFKETLEDIPINVFPFILDTKKIYDSDENIMIFHSIEDVKNTMSQNPNPTDSDTDQANFDAYSDYIDTIIQYVKNL